MFGRYLSGIVAIMAVVCFAMLTQSETGTDALVVLPDAPDAPSPDLNPQLPDPDDWNIVSYGPNLPSGAYLDLPNQYKPANCCPNCGYRLQPANYYGACGCQSQTYSCYGSCGGGYGIFGNQARPFWQRGPLRRLLSFPFRRRGCW